MRAKCLSIARMAVLAAGPAVLAAPALAGATAGGDRLDMAIGAMNSGHETPSEIVVMGNNGRYDRVTSHSILLPLALSADLAADGSAYKILKSEVFLKSEGSSAATPDDTLGGQTPARSISRADTLTFGFSPQGPVAQTAITLCNGLSADDRASGKVTTLAMGVAVRWQVTTGRFTFKWTDYDRVAPSDEILRNADFYADQATQDAEALIEAAVRCEPLVQETPAVAELAAPVRQAALKTETQIQPAISAPVKSAALNITEKPRCDGGMVRQLASGAQDFLCLCPGNTARVSLGENAYACEKRNKRRSF